jgi:hypothetical protein
MSSNSCIKRCILIQKVFLFSGLKMDISGDSLGTDGMESLDQNG